MGGGGGEGWDLKTTGRMGEIDNYSIKGEMDIFWNNTFNNNWHN